LDSLVIVARHRGVHLSRDQLMRDHQLRSADVTIARTIRIAAAAGLVFVTPQYNWGYPAALKNALDHLYLEWAGKPALIVAYGGHGGTRCAAQLSQVCEGLRMSPVTVGPGLTLSRERIEADNSQIDPAQELAGHADALRQALAAFGAVVTGR